MKARNLALFLAFVVAAWLPILAQQSAAPSQERSKATAAEPVKQDGGSCADCCKAHEAADKNAAEHHMADCCAAKDGKAMECCQGKEGKQGACCAKDKDAKSAMDCCKAHDAGAKNGKHCCGKDAMACNSKDKKGCCTGEQCAAHAS